MNTLSKSTLLSTGLLASLALNIFILGAIFGHHFSHTDLMAGHMPPLMDPQQGMMMHFERALPPDDARIFSEEMHRDLPPPDDAAMAASFKVVHDALTAPDFSPTNFQQALQHLHDQRGAMDKNFTQALTNAVSKISIEGRQRLANALPSHPPMGNAGPMPGSMEGPLPPPDGNR